MEVYLNPNGFKGEVDSFKRTTSELAGLSAKNTVDANQETILDSVSELIAIVNLFSECVEQYMALSNKDVAEMESLKEKWVQKDLQLANEMDGN
ncbi:hypothetical protein [Sporosarcina pasteurii]|uniref:Type VII secretion effector n=1 Tax=Sporosarcina pasteurii TaxID=1474 RepID=A0A380BD02_SPOPA|nr:hypothetical protein [Sporosarcina pasteurii]MDS9472572.1 hypothetical protein [Sporosarcina pasteurii]QBQ06125.1 hypothetical protein E2C16_10775 [Sporosarcina pasteurii]SUI99381.1 Uncharacterised protein [Sporosarcina pasteurii]